MSTCNTHTCTLLDLLEQPQDRFRNTKYNNPTNLYCHPSNPHWPLSTTANQSLRALLRPQRITTLSLYPPLLLPQQLHWSPYKRTPQISQIKCLHKSRHWPCRRTRLLFLVYGNGESDDEQNGKEWRFAGEKEGGKSGLDVVVGEIFRSGEGSVPYKEVDDELDVVRSVR
jgi:hypothetical protein